jgi:hypothetical protein
MNKKKPAKKVNQVQRQRGELEIGELAQVYGSGGIFIMDTGTKDGGDII